LKKKKNQQKKEPQEEKIEEEEEEIEVIDSVKEENSTLVHLLIFSYETLYME
jgi:hypothetical protein